MPTVIDSLIVKLGLDPSDFTKGEKQVASEVLKTKDTVTRANKEMGNSFVSFAKSVLAVVGGVALIGKAVGGILRMSAEIRALDRNSRNLDMSAASLRNYGNAIEALGGNAEDALSDIQAFAKSFFELQYMGSASPQLEMLARLGVEFQNATGDAREFGEVAKDAGDKVRDLIKSGQTTRASGILMLRQAGLSDVMATAALDGTLMSELARQRATHRQITPGIAAEATGLERSRVEMRQDREDVAITTMRDAEKAAQVLEDVTNKLTDGLMKFITWIDGVVGNGTSAYAAPAAGIRSGAVPTRGTPKNAGDVMVMTKDGVAVPRSTLGAADAALTAPRTGFAGWLQRKGAESADKLAQSRDPLRFAADATPTPSVSTKGPTTVNVGPVTVNTQARDAEGIATDFAGAVQRKTHAAQAEPGMQ